MLEDGALAMLALADVGLVEGSAGGEGYQKVVVELFVERRASGLQLFLMLLRFRIDICRKD